MTSLLVDAPSGREFHVQRGDISLRAVDFGDPDAPTIVAVHGFASNLTANWIDSGWVRMLLAEGYRVVAFDHRGHGESSRPLDAASYSLTAFVDDVAAVVDAAARATVDLIGYSLGARLCAEYAIRSPERVRTLSLGGMDDHDPLGAFDVAAARDFVTSHRPIADQATAGLMTMATALPGNDPQALLACAEGLQASATNAAHGVTPTPPTLVVCGTKDVIAPDGERFAASLPRGSFVPLAGRTHVNALTARAFKNAVAEHLTQGGSPRG